MRRIDHTAELCIIGGGLSGVAAALSAARRGVKVLVMQDRPVLGGNASSEIRMWVRGAKGLHNRETGIISELEEENIYRNPTLCYSIWDSVIWGKVKDEPNIELLLNCSCVDAVTEKTSTGTRVCSVTGWQLTTYTWHTVKAKYFSDCSGDSVLATLTGARWRVGRESRSEFGERMGHEVADKKTMGMSCLLQARETDRPVKFTPPEWAYVYPEDTDFIGTGKKRFSLPDDEKTVPGEKSAEQLLAEGASISGIEIKTTSSCIRTHDLGTSKGNFWWIELGGEDDSIHDAELLVLDEPTSGLDPVSRDDLLDVLLALCDEGKTVLFSTHITSDLDKCAHNIIYIRDGKIVADAPTRVFEDSYRTVTYRDGEGAEDEKYFLGKRRERDGFTALVRAADAPLIGRKCEKPDLESIMVHLEKGV